MTFVTYDRRFRDPKLYPLEALKVGIGAPLAEPRAALGAADAATNSVPRHLAKLIRLGVKRNAA